MWIVIEIIMTILMIYTLIVHARVMYNMIKGCLAMSKVEDTGESIVCETLLYNKKAYIIKIITAAFVLWAFGKLLGYAKAFGVLWAEGIYIMLIVVEVFEILENLVALIKDKNAYLTKEGLMACMGIMEPRQCRYAWEQSANGEETHILLVYKGKMKSPYRFRILERFEQAQNIIQSFGNSDGCNTNADFR